MFSSKIGTLDRVKSSVGKKNCVFRGQKTEEDLRGQRAKTTKKNGKNVSGVRKRTCIFDFVKKNGYRKEPKNDLFWMPTWTSYGLRTRALTGKEKALQ